VDVGFVQIEEQPEGEKLSTARSRNVGELISLTELQVVGRILEASFEIAES
jgi:hypothetical protein